MLINGHGVLKWRTHPFRTLIPQLWNVVVITPVKELGNSINLVMERVILYDALSSLSKMVVKDVLISKVSIPGVTFVVAFGMVNGKSVHIRI